MASKRRTPKSNTDASSGRNNKKQKEDDDADEVAPVKDEDDERDFGFSALSNGTSHYIARWIEHNQTHHTAKRAREAEGITREQLVQLPLSHRLALRVAAPTIIEQLVEAAVPKVESRAALQQTQDPLPPTVTDVSRSLSSASVQRFASTSSLSSASNTLPSLRPPKTSPFVLDRANELLVSLTINLFPSCFTIDSSSIAYPYEEPYKQFVRAIDTHRLSPDVLDVLSEKEVHFYDGCVVVEVRDYRTSASASALADAPRVRRVLLEPRYDTIVRDAGKMAAAHDIHSDFELIEIEKRMLMAMSKPLCLVPDVNVFLIGTATQFARRKFEIKPKAIAALLAPGAPAAASASSGKSDLFQFLLQRSGGRKPQGGGGGSGQPLPLQGVPPLPSGTIHPIITPNLSDSIGGRRAAQADLSLGRESKFDRAPGRRVFYALRLAQRNGLYSGVLRAGASPDTSTNGSKTVFVLGYRDGAAAFLEQMMSTFHREGYIRSILQTQVARAPSSTLVAATPATPAGSDVTSSTAAAVAPSATVTTPVTSSAAAAATAAAAAAPVAATSTAAAPAVAEVKQERRGRPRKGGN